MAMQVQHAATGGARRRKRTETIKALLAAAVALIMALQMSNVLAYAAESTEDAGAADAGVQATLPADGDGADGAAVQDEESGWGGGF